MSELQLKEIADNADMIIANYAFTITENGDIKVLFLSNPNQAAYSAFTGRSNITTPIEPCFS